MFKPLDDEWFGVIFEKEKRLLSDSFSDAAHLGSKWVVKRSKANRKSNAHILLAAAVRLKVENK